MCLKHLKFKEKLKWLDALYLRMEGLSALRDSDALIESHILITKCGGDITSIMFQGSLD